MKNQAPTRTTRRFFINNQSPLENEKLRALNGCGRASSIQRGFLFLGILLIALTTNAYAQEVELNKIAMIESSGNPRAWNKKDDSRGLYQITPICLKEFNNFHPNKKYTRDDLWTVSVNTEIADWYLNKRIPQMLRHYGRPDTIENRLIAYNAGISYVVSGKQIPEITKSYIRKYNR